MPPAGRAVALSVPLRLRRGLTDCTKLTFLPESLGALTRLQILCALRPSACALHPEVPQLLAGSLENREIGYMHNQFPSVAPLHLAMCTQLRCCLLRGAPKHQPHKPRFACAGGFVAQPCAIFPNPSAT